MSEVKLIRYYLKLVHLGVQQTCLVTLDDIAEQFSSSKRHARTLIQQMQSSGWLKWQPVVGRHQRSSLYLNYSSDDIRLQVASSLIHRGAYEKALELLEGDQRQFGRLLQDTSGVRHSSGELSLQLTYYRSFAPLQPHLLHRNSERFLLRQIYSNLVRCNSDGIIEPDLAHHWKSDEQALLWRFYLRPGLTFHDGQKINAHCLVRLFSGLKNKPVLRAMFSHLQAVSAISDFCVEFQLSESDFGFAGLLSDPCCAIQPPEQLNSDIAKKYLTGSGPFKLVEHSQERLKLQPFNDYYGCRALPDKVSIWNVPEQSAFAGPSLKNDQLQSSCHYYLLGNSDDAAVNVMKSGPQARLEQGCEYLLFNRAKSSEGLSLPQRRWLSSLLAPEKLSEQMSCNIEPADHLLTCWKPVLRLPQQAVELPKKLTIAVYHQSSLSQCNEVIVKLLQEIDIECQINSYSFHELSGLARTRELKEDLVLTSKTLDDNWPSSAFYWFYADPIFQVSMTGSELEWIKKVMEMVRASRPLTDYLSALESLATTVIANHWLLPLFHHRQVLQFQNILHGVSLSHYGWPEIRDVWVEP